MARRKDATRVKFAEPFHSIVPYIMPKRTEAEVFLRDTFDVTDLMEYIKQYNLENGTNLKFFHCFCYAIAKTIYHRPQMTKVSSPSVSFGFCSCAGWFHSSSPS